MRQNEQLEQRMLFQSNGDPVARVIENPLAARRRVLCIIASS
jgi:hypothetical protein